MPKKRFSRRRGLEPPEAEITIRFEAPEDMRENIVDVAEENGLRPSTLRGILCALLRVPADPTIARGPGRRRGLGPTVRITVPAVPVR